MAQFQLGSISTGTLKTEDLIHTFTDTLEALSPNGRWHGGSHTELISDGKLAIIPDTEQFDTDYEVLNDIQDALNELCPPFVYFGTLEGDGADFGFWPDMETVNEIVLNACKDNPDYATYDVLDGDGVHCPDDGVIIQVSDHGNVTVMDMQRNVLWSVV
jgi:hypothetical protein